MHERFKAACMAGLLAAGLADVALADRAGAREHGYALRWQDHERSFQRVGTLANYLNNAARTDETVSEIVAATADGMTLVYTDGTLGQIGFVDIADTPYPETIEASRSVGSQLYEYRLRGR